MKPEFKYLPDVWRVYHFVNLKFTVVRAALSPLLFRFPFRSSSLSLSLSLFVLFSLLSPSSNSSLFPPFALFPSRLLPLLSSVSSCWKRAEIPLIVFDQNPRRFPLEKKERKKGRTFCFFEHGLSEHDRRRAAPRRQVSRVNGAQPSLHRPVSFLSAPFRFCSLCLRSLPAYFYSTHLVYKHSSLSPGSLPFIRFPYRCVCGDSLLGTRVRGAK